MPDFQKTSRPTPAVEPSPVDPAPLSRASLPKPASARPTPPVRHHRLRWTLVTLAGLFLVVLVTGGWLVYRAVSSVNTQPLNGSNQKLSWFQQLTKIVTEGDQRLNGEGEDRINLLLLGIGGPGHDGPYLTDTIMVASVKPSTKQVALLSVPRDLVVNIPGYDYRKINNVLSFGRDRKYPGGGDALVVKVVGEFLNLPIQYYARVDFGGFQEIIDRLGGVEVTVDRAFTDGEYPDNNYGYQTVRFQAGTQTMDGAAALKFARSRHGNNSEGSDFARAARQQKIILATRDRALSLGTLLNPKKISDILGSISTHHQTNLEVWEMIRLAKLVNEVKASDVIARVLDNSPTGLLQAATGQAGAYILEPKDDTGQDIQFLAKNLFLIGAAEREQATILVANATGQAGLADSMGKALAGLGFKTVAPLTIRDTAVTQTVLIDQSGGRMSKTLEVIGRYARVRGTISLAAWVDQTADDTLAARLAIPTSTNGNANASNTNTDGTAITLILILGQDQSPTQARTSGGSS